MCVGGGGGGGTWENTRAGANGGGGGAYAYVYNYAVTPGTGYTVQVGCGGNTPERLGTVYWDSQDNGVTNDLDGYSSIGGGGIASWFVDRSTCRGGGGMNGRTATISSGAFRTGTAYGGVSTIGGGLSGGGKRGGQSGTAENVSSFPPAFSGGGAAGTAASQEDTSGGGSAIGGQSLSGGSTGGGGGGGAGYSFLDAITVTAPAFVVAWSTFMNTYAVWNTSFSATITYTVYRTFTAPSTGTYYFRSSADNDLLLYVDETLISGTTTFNVTPSPVLVTLSAGTHILKFVVYNNESFAGFAVTISNSSDTLIWDTRTNATDAIVGLSRYTAGGGGGIGIYGITATAPGSGAAGSIATLLAVATGGGGGSGGQAGYAGEDISSQTGTLNPSNGGKYGGGGGGGKKYNGYGSYGGHGVVRILLDSGSAYPSTNTGDSYTARAITTSSGTYTVTVNEQLYDTPGAYYWICPPGVTSVCVLCIGGGGRGYHGGGAGGGYAYINNYPVTPGQGYLVVVGAGSPNGEYTSYGYGLRASGTGNVYDYAIVDNIYSQFYTGDDANSNPPRMGGDASYFNSFFTVLGGGGEDGDLNFSTNRSSFGGVSYHNPAYSGGGARGGYAQDGTQSPGSVSPYVATSYSWGGGGGAGGGGPAGGTSFESLVGGGGRGASAGNRWNGDPARPEPGPYFAAGGGGIGVFGIGESGTDGTREYYPEASGLSTHSYGDAGTGGSGGQPGVGGIQPIRGGDGGSYGGGGGGGFGTSPYSDPYGGGYGAPGAVRIIWGAGRSFGNTNTASTTTSVTIPMPPPRTYRVSNQAIFETPGRYTWIVPPGVTSISVMAVGAGGGGAIGYIGNGGSANGGGGGGYAYMYNYSVTPGTGYTIQVGAGGNTDERVYGGQYWDANDDGTTIDKGASGGPGGIASWFANAAVCRGGGGTDGSGASGIGGSAYQTRFSFGGYYTLGAGLSGGGKAGGMSDQVFSGAGEGASFGGGGGAGTQATGGGFGTDGMGGYYSGDIYSGGSTGGGGGGGGGFSASSPAKARSAGGGGGIGILGITATAPGSGAAGTMATSSVNSGGGSGGSGGQSGYAGEDFTSGTGTATPSNGGKYGGGGGGGRSYGGRGSFGGHGVVRIIWGASRAYPSTDTGDSYSTVTF